MFESLRRIVGGGPELPGWAELAAWARARHWPLRRAVTHDGWVMTPPDRADWRIEWGPSQRSFMSAHEYRVRIDAPNIVEAQALVVDRPLLARMDHEVYQQATEDVQTRYDDQLPEEMRWLAMHARLGTAELGTLRERYGALGDDAHWVARWLGGGLADALRQRAGKLTVDAVSAEPLMVRVARGQLVLRQGAERPEPASLEVLLAVARAADEATRRMPPS